MQTSAISISYKYMTHVCALVHVCMCVRVCVQACHLTELFKVQGSVSGMLTLLGQFPITSFVADIKYQRWTAVNWENISTEENEDLEEL
jgi:hypothetical protein